MPASEASSIGTTSHPLLCRAKLDKPEPSAGSQPPRSRPSSCTRSGTHLNQPADIDDGDLINIHVVRVEVQSDRLVIELAKAKGDGSRRHRSRNVIEVPWRKTPSTRRREILVSESTPHQDARPIRSENRATLVASIARARRWLNELTTDPAANTESIAAREGCSVRKVNMTISLAFLAPDLVKAAIEGRLPHGMGVVRLSDLPAEWSRQHQMLGLISQ